jgi:hypothetical protein
MPVFSVNPPRPKTVTEASDPFHFLGKRLEQGDVTQMGYRKGAWFPLHFFLLKAEFDEIHQNK